MTPEILRCAMALVIGLLEAGGQVQRQDALGFHGTSVEAIVEAARSGRLPLGNGGGEAKAKRRHWYFYPNVTTSSWNRLVAQGQVRLQSGTLPGYEEEPLEDAWKGAQSYAETIAQQHALLSELKLPITDANVDLAGTYLQDPNDAAAVQGLLALGILRSHLTAAYKVARTAKGVVVMIGPNAAEQMRVSNAVGSDDGVRFESPDGVALEALIALEPMGKREFQILSSLPSPK